MKNSSPATRSVSKSKAKVVAKVQGKVTKPIKKVSHSPRVSQLEESIWTKQYLMNEQVEFHEKHRSARLLISLFIGTLVLFVYVVWLNRTDVMPQFFPMS